MTIGEIISLQSGDFIQCYDAQTEGGFNKKKSVMRVLKHLGDGIYVQLHWKNAGSLVYLSAEELNLRYIRKKYFKIYQKII